MVIYIGCSELNLFDTIGYVKVLNMRPHIPNLPLILTKNVPATAPRGLISKNIKH